jgi:hypothetical protein
MKDYQIIQLALALNNLADTLYNQNQQKNGDRIHKAMILILNPLTQRLRNNLTALLDSHNFGLMTNLEFIQRVTEEVMNYIEKD